MNNGGPAFPFVVDGCELECGMTLRDYFAAKAMQGFIATELAGYNAQQIARNAYEIADAMLAAREES